MQGLICIALERAAVCVVADGHKCLAAIRGNLHHLLLHALVQVGHVVALHGPHGAPPTGLHLESCRLKPECRVLVQQLTAVVCGEVVARCWDVLSYKGVHSPGVLDSLGDQGGDRLGHFVFLWVVWLCG